MSNPMKPAAIQWVSPPQSIVPSSRSTATLIVPNRVEFVRPAATFLVHAARVHHVPAASQPVFEIAVTEALTNAVKHGRPLQGEASIVCEIELYDRQLRLRIIDGGRGFRIPDRSLPNVNPHDIQSLPESGYGLPIIQSVFPIVRAIDVNNRFGVEMELAY
jgi:anti-sigma regulatory factor (Ser/Thr protein kinase)